MRRRREHGAWLDAEAEQLTRGRYCGCARQVSCLAGRGTPGVDAARCVRGNVGCGLTSTGSHLRSTIDISAVDVYQKNNVEWAASLELSKVH